MAQIELIVCRQHDRTHPDGYDSKSCEAPYDRNFAQKKRPAFRLTSLEEMF